MDFANIFGTCSCGSKRYSASWCVNCDVTYLVDKFNNWTSGDPKIDDFIKHTQKNAKECMGFLEWIDFSQFDLVSYTGRAGAFSTIYSAVWMEGPLWIRDEDAEIWTRGGPTNVVLKRLNNSRELGDEFFNQLYTYFKCLYNGSLADCFGLTRDDTSCIMIVLRYYNKGDIYSYLNSCEGFLCWRDVVDVLWSISAGLYKIHELDLIHGHLHGGNILVEQDENTTDAKITDTGLHGPFNTHSEGIFGVVPFVAPEIFKGVKQTKASDIYSIGMIMWMISTGERPYRDRPHDDELINEIISGLRPQPAKETPLIYAQLMKKCLSADPLERPSASDLYNTFEKWMISISDDPVPSEISEQFDIAENAKFNAEMNKRDYFLPIHQYAIYYSRNLFELIQR